MGRIKELSRKPALTRKRNPVVYLICEGSETEIRYFKRFRSRGSTTCSREMRLTIQTSTAKLTVLPHTVRFLLKKRFLSFRDKVIW